MIKINLLRDKDKKRTAGGPEVTQFEGIGALGGVASSNKGLLGKIGLIIVPIALAYAYSWYVESNLNNQIKAVEQKLAQTQAQTDALKPQINEIEKLNLEKNKINTQIGVIRELSKGRYGTVKIMDALQTLIPEKAWVVKLNLKDRIINLEGRAIDDLIISTFMQNLEESLYFSNVTWIDSKEVNEPQGIVKQFSIRFQLEKI